MGFNLGSLLKIAAPIAGFALGGPAGAMIGGGAAGLLSGAQSAGRAGKLNAEALQLARQRQQFGAPFRSRLAQLAMNMPSQREDTSALFADPGNPYARAIPRPAPAAPPIAAQPTIPTTGGPRRFGRPVGGGIGGFPDKMRSRLALEAFT